MSAEASPGEETFSSLLLEELKQRLLQAFRGEKPGPASSSSSSCPGARPLPRRAAEGGGKSGSRSARAAQEELRRAHLEGAMAWLRVELLEMKSQNQKLARTLLDLSTEIQRLRKENDLSAAVESETLNMATIPE